MAAGVDTRIQERLERQVQQTSSTVGNNPRVSGADPERNVVKAWGILQKSAVRRELH
jgi:hypothetical protein